MALEVAVGIDIGGTYTKLGFVGRTGKLFEHEEVLTNKYVDIQDYILDLKETIGVMSARANHPTILGIGIGAPNANAYNGTIETAPNLRWKGIIPLVARLKKHYDLPIVLVNDANAAALGEMYYGGGKGMRDFVMITLGTGLGGGIISNRQLIQGYNSFAGEIGHTIVNVNGRRCGCGRKGCLETYVSATGIKRTVYKFLADSLQTSALRDMSFNQLTPKMIGAAAQAQDKIAIKAFEYTGRILGTKLADTAVYTNPQAIFLFGGLVKAGAYILKPTLKAFKKNLIPILKEKVNIRISELQEQNPAILGSAGLVWDKLGERVD